MADNFKASPRSRVAQIGHFVDPAHGAIVPPIQFATTFARDETHELMGEFLYSRYGSPTVAQAEAALAELEGAEAALLYASGLAGIVAVCEALHKGQHMVAPRIMYHGAQSWMRRIAERRGIGLDFYETSDPKSLARVVHRETALVWGETIVNPTWDVLDIAAAADIAHEAGALLVVDSTCAPPVTTRPLDLGADMVFHSATKYLNGHSDLTGGVLAVKSRNALWDDVVVTRKYLGSIMAPFEAWLLMRGMRTVFVRFEAISAAALKIARGLEGNGKVERVLYPGLPSHPDHQTAVKQMSNGFGGMMSLLVKGGEAEAKRFVTSLKLFLPATSLGGVESLAEHRRTAEGPTSEVAPNLVRLSIGIEDGDDLLRDVEQALERI
ncbi:cystathionine gamma-synthase [Rhodoligotrophos appendicifer]|uniref:trans-sulfuration enzyme family protein n=1 Tax=Rhodoligotrophos appendicifer TaxID=987056 RepID=UPI00117D9BBD|nr:aminotransferase class V-fold PLP-dependent enzyme [Rhodoligotrophos appendicifer]